MLSWMLLEGQIVPPDPAEARRLAEAAAAQGNAAAMTRLGMIHHNALGVERDPAAAARWWARPRRLRRRRRPGDARRRPAHGPGRARDPYAGFVWLLRAQAGGSELAYPFLRAAEAACRSRRPAAPAARPTSRSGPAMIVGTAGHIDHGKTSLVRALTGVDADRLKEEKARGITIDLGFAYMPAPDGAVVGFVDVPGHERFVHNMLAGATGIDLALLVVAADDGVMPQTREHLAILDLLGITPRPGRADQDRPCRPRRASPLPRAGSPTRSSAPASRAPRSCRSPRSPARASRHCAPLAPRRPRHAGPPAERLPPRRRPLLHPPGRRHRRHRHGPLRPRRRRRPPRRQPRAASRCASAASTRRTARPSAAVPATAARSTSPARASQGRDRTVAT